MHDVCSVHLYEIINVVDLSRLEHEVLSGGLSVISALRYGNEERRDGISFERAIEL